MNVNVADLRSEFTVYIVDGDYAAAEKLVSLVKTTGYDTRYYPTLDSAISGAREAPPHVILFNYEIFVDIAEDFLNKLQDVSPEILTILLLAAKQTIPALQLVEKNLAFDYQVRPLVSNLELIQKIDRAAQRLYFQFESEQLRDSMSSGGNAESVPTTTGNMQAGGVVKDGSKTSPSLPSAGGGVAEASDTTIEPEVLSRFLEQMTGVKDIERTIQVYLDALSAQMHNTPAIYFRYIPHYLSLVLSHATWLPIEKIRGIGVELKSIDPTQLPEQFQNPSQIEPLRHLLKAAFKVDNFSVFTHYSESEVLGVVVLFDPLQNSRSAQAAKVFWQIFELTYRRNSVLKEKHTLEVHDSVTGLSNRKYFRSKLDEEMARARRIALPVSLVVIDIDHFKDLNKLIGVSNADTVLKMIGSLLKKTTRVSDVLARLGADEIALLLPHTDHMGAAMKAERIRRIVESTRFPALIGRPIDHVTVSIGVSEYPAFCSDADMLLKTSDEALLQVKEAGGNRVCLATAMPGFSPDFVPKPVQDQDPGSDRRRGSTETGSADGQRPSSKSDRDEGSL